MAAGPGLSRASCCPASPTSATTGATGARWSPSPPAGPGPRRPSKAPWSTGPQGARRPRRWSSPPRCRTACPTAASPIHPAGSTSARSPRATTSCSGVLDENRNHLDDPREAFDSVRVRSGQANAAGALGLRARHLAAADPDRHGDRQHCGERRVHPIARSAAAASAVGGPPLADAGLHAGEGPLAPAAPDRRQPHSRRPAARDSAPADTAAAPRRPPPPGAPGARPRDARRECPAHHPSAADRPAGAPSGDAVETRRQVYGGDQGRPQRHRRRRRRGRHAGRARAARARHPRRPGRFHAQRLSPPAHRQRPAAGRQAGADEAHPADSAKPAPAKRKPGRRCRPSPLAAPTTPQ